MNIDRLDFALRDGIDTGELTAIDLPVEHLHPTGLYVREIHMPAGTVLTSRVHLYEHLTVALTGHCIVIDEDGNRTEVTAPDRWITPAGTQRAIHILEDSRWLTVHATDETDPDTLFNTLTCASMHDYQHRLMMGDL